jgi:hypothetical protein
MSPISQNPFRVFPFQLFYVSLTFLTECSLRAHFRLPLCKYDLLMPWADFCEAYGVLFKLAEAKVIVLTGGYGGRL